MGGKLYIVPTPIGNLEDITLRAIKVLENADLILCEDTRTSSVLLNHLQIRKPLKSYHKFNEHKATDYFVDLLLSGQNIALISDAGTPAISDPGFLLVRSALEKEVSIETLPGPTALIPALVNSGFACDKFCFEGFLPQKKGKKSTLETLSTESRTIIFYESPYRVVKTLEMIKEIFIHNPQISASREISKKFEQTVRGSASELIEWFTEHPPKGEFVMVIEGKKKNKEQKDKNREEEEV